MSQVIIYANPYCSTLDGFFFSSFEEYTTKLAKAKAVQNSTDFEHSLEMIKGDSIINTLFDQLSIAEAFEVLDEVNDLNVEQKIVVQYLINKYETPINEVLENLEDHAIIESLNDVADQFLEMSGVKEGSKLQMYFNYEAYTQDLLLNDYYIEFSYYSEDPTAQHGGLINFYIMNPCAVGRVD